MRIHNIFPDEFPEPWASDWGEDDYGIFMGFTYKGVRQDFRWIEPGTFLMGSPKDEPERESNGADETQHKVTLTKGFWLADTIVIQALWEAIMGKNPSRFKGENRPVETISWNDAQAFIDKMNGMKAELRLCLPTEAQWEYACRAGTTSRYTFGDALTQEQANFNASQTVEVKSYLPNNWGLYDIHGNIWEWCQDWYGDYPTQPVVDPQGVKSGTSRVLRGGSWGNDLRVCRSAYRNRDVPASHIFGVGNGFRLARGLWAFSQDSQEQASSRLGHPCRSAGGTSAGDTSGGWTADVWENPGVYCRSSPWLRSATLVAFPSAQALLGHRLLEAPLPETALGATEILALYSPGSRASRARYPSGA